MCHLNGSEVGLFTSVNNVVDKSLLKSVCFTEAPLDQIKHFAQPLPEPCGHEYSSYGLVFEQDYIRRSGGNPCFYVNTLDDPALKKAITALADAMVSLNTLSPTNPEITKNRTLFGKVPCCWTKTPHELSEAISKVLPFFNIYGPSGHSSARTTRDFYWEREWRVPGDLVFKHEDVFCGLCEDQYIGWYSQNYPQIPFICPEWNDDRIFKKLRDWSRPQPRPYDRCPSCGFPYD